MPAIAGIQVANVGENGRFYGENDQFYVENCLEKCFENEPHSEAVDQKIDWGHSGDLGGAACNVVQPMVDDSERGMYLRNEDFSANSGEYGAGYDDFEYMQAVLDGVNGTGQPPYDDPGLSSVRTEGPYGQKSDLHWEAGCISSSNSASGGDCGLGDYAKFGNFHDADARVYGDAGRSNKKGAPFSNVDDGNNQIPATQNYHGAPCIQTRGASGG